MKWTAIGLVLLGIVAAVCAVVLVNALRVDAASRAGADRRAPEAPREVEIVVAAKSIPAMSQLDARALTTTSVPVDQAPKDHFADPALVAGRVLATPLAQGQVLTADCLIAKGSPRDFSRVLPPGMRAVSVSLPSHSGLDPILYAGSIVDVLVSLKLPASGTLKSDVVATTLLERVQVLAVENETVVSSESASPGGRARQSMGRNRVITLLVDTKQALTLRLAMEYGTVSLAMRSPLDDALGPFEDVLLTELSPEYAARLAAETEAEKKAEAPEESQEEVKEEPQVVQATPGPLNWEVVVVRGGQMEKRSFPVPPGRAAQARVGTVGQRVSEVGTE